MSEACPKDVVSDAAVMQHVYAVPQNIWPALLLPNAPHVTNSCIASPCLPAVAQCQYVEHFKASKTHNLRNRTMSCAIH